MADDLIEQLLHLDGRNREIGCKAVAYIRKLEAATIERCARVAEEGWRPVYIAAAIRALKPSGNPCP
jgi:hypothetical protein